MGLFTTLVKITIMQSASELLPLFIVICFRLHEGCKYPPSMMDFPFICLLCTVWAVLQCKLMDTPQGYHLLMFEHMRLIDMAHAWASSTMVGFEHHVKCLWWFGSHFGINLCRLPSLAQSPHGDIIPIMQAISEYMLQPTQSTWWQHDPGAMVSYNFSWALQSAASTF